MQRLRKRKRQSILEREENESKIIQTQQKMQDNLNILVKNQEKLIEEQKKSNFYLASLLQQQQTINECLQSINKNICILAENKNKY